MDNYIIFKCVEDWNEGFIIDVNNSKEQIENNIVQNICKLIFQNGHRSIFFPKANAFLVDTSERKEAESLKISIEKEFGLSGLRIGKVREFSK